MWKTAKLTDIANVSTGRWDANHSEKQGKYRFYTCASKYLFSNTKRFSGKCLILPGNGANVGDVYYYDGEFDTYQRTYVIHDIDILPQYLMYHMSMDWKKKNEKKQYGSATNFIKIGNFQDYLVSFPPLPIQKQIVEKLDAAFADINKAISATQKNIKNAEALFCQSLDVLLQTKTLKNTTLKIGSSERIGGSWELKKLGDICTFTRGLTYSKKDEVKKSSNRVLRATNIDLETHTLKLDDIRYISDNINIKKEKKVMQNDILICTASGSKSHLGKVSLIDSPIDFAFGGFMAVIRTNEKILPQYLFKILISQDFKSHIAMLSDGANINNLKFDSIKDFPIYFPPLPVQKLIVEKLDAISKESMNLEKRYKKKILDLIALKSALLNQAFSNKLTKSTT